MPLRPSAYDGEKPCPSGAPASAMRTSGDASTTVPLAKASVLTMSEGTSAALTQWQHATIAAHQRSRAIDGAAGTKDCHASPAPCCCCCCCPLGESATKNPPSAWARALHHQLSRSSGHLEQTVPRLYSSKCCEIADLFIFVHQRTRPRSSTSPSSCTADGDLHCQTQPSVHRRADAGGRECTAFRRGRRRAGGQIERRGCRATDEGGSSRESGRQRRERERERERDRERERERWARAAGWRASAVEAPSQSPRPPHCLPSHRPAQRATQTTPRPTSTRRCSWCS